MKFWALKLACAFCAAGLAAALSSCGGGGAEFYPLKAGGQRVFGAAKSPSEVAVFITKKPDFPYDELGMIVYETSRISQTSPPCTKNCGKRPRKSARTA